MDAPPPWACRDEGSIIVGWLTRLTLVLTLLGVLAFEVMSIAIAHIQVEDYGTEAGQEAIDVYQQTRDPRLAYLAATAVATEHQATIPRQSFQVADDGTVSFDLRATAPTLLLFRWSRTADLAEVTTTIYQEPIEQSGRLP